MVSRVIPVQAFDLVVFGGTGDLAKRKILPSLFRRFVAGQMPNDAFVIGVARSELDTKSYQDLPRFDNSQPFVFEYGKHMLDICRWQVLQ